MKRPPRRPSVPSRLLASVFLLLFFRNLPRSTRIIVASIVSVFYPASLKLRVRGVIRDFLLSATTKSSWFVERIGRTRGSMMVEIFVGHFRERCCGNLGNARTAGTFFDVKIFPSESVSNRVTESERKCLRAAESRTNEYAYNYTVRGICGLFTSTPVQRWLRLYSQSSLQRSP